MGTMLYYPLQPVKQCVRIKAQCRVTAGVSALMDTLATPVLVSQDTIIITFVTYCFCCLFLFFFVIQPFFYEMRSITCIRPLMSWQGIRGVIGVSLFNLTLRL